MTTFGETALFGWGQVISKQQLLHLVVYFSSPPPLQEKLVLCLTGGQVEYVFVVWRDTIFIVHTLGTLPVFASPSALKKEKKKTELRQVDWYTCLCDTLPITWLDKWLSHIPRYALGLSSVIQNGVTGRVSAAPLIKEALGCAVTHG